MDWSTVERSILRVSWAQPAVLAHVVRRLSAYRPDDPHRAWLWIATVRHFETTGEPPTVPFLYEVIEKDKPAHVVPRLTELLLIARLSLSPAPFTAIEQLDKRARRVKMVEAVKGATEALQRGDDDSAMGALERGTAIPGAGPQPVRLAVPLSTMKPSIRVPTGLTALDRIIGGLGKKELGLLMGVTGMGKSTFAVNLGHGAIKHNFKVLHFDTENGEEIVRARYYARFTGIPFESIYKQTLATADRERLDAWIERNDERLWQQIRPIFLGNNESRLTDVEGVIRSCKADGFVPDLVLIDSPDHLLLPAQRDRWVGFVDLYNQLDRTTKRHELGLWAFSQAALEFEGKIATNAAATDSKHKPKVASLVMTINMAFDDDGKPKTNGDRAGYISKNRTGPGRHIVPLQTDLVRSLYRAEPPEERDDEEET